MPHGDLMRANFLALSDGACDIDNFVDTMTTHLSDLETRLEGKMADWGGDARAAYKTEKVIWDGAASNIATMLRGLSKAVKDSNEELKATEKRCEHMFLA